MKIAKSMSVLSKQLELVEAFESKTEMASGLYDDECIAFANAVSSAAREEKVIVEEMEKHVCDMKIVK